MKHKTNWVIDHMNTEISFTVNHLMSDTVIGSFKHYDAIIHSIEDDLTTVEIDMCIDAASIDTGEKERNEYLKGPDFLDTDHHNYILFNSESIKKTDRSGFYELCGALTIKGMSERLKLDLEVTEITKDITGKERITLKASGRMRRNNWGLTWNNIAASGGLMVDEEISILCAIQIVKGTDKGLMIEADQKREIRFPSLAGISYRLSR